PDIRGDEWTMGNWLLLAAMLVILLAWCWWVYRRAAEIGVGSRFPDSPGNDSRPLFLTTAVVAALVAAFTAATALGDRWTHPRSLPEDGDARTAAAAALVDHDICFCFTSARGRIDWMTLRPNAVTGAVIGVETDALDMKLQVIADGHEHGPAFGRFHV